MSLYFAALTRPIHVYILPRPTNALYILTDGPCTYTCVHFIAPIYIYMYTNFYEHIPIHDYILLCSFNYTCLCTSRSTYMYMFMFLYTYLYILIHTHLYIPSLPYTYTWLHNCTSLYRYMFISFYANIPLPVYIHKRPYSLYQFTSTTIELYVFYA